MLPPGFKNSRIRVKEFILMRKFIYSLPNKAFRGLGIVKGFGRWEYIQSLYGYIGYLDGDNWLEYKEYLRRFICNKSGKFVWGKIWIGYTRIECRPKRKKVYWDHRYIDFGAKDRQADWNI